MNAVQTSRARQAALAVLIFSAVAATAQTAPAPAEPRVWLRVSAFRPTVDSQIRLGRTQSVINGTDISGENDLSLARHPTVPALTLGLRISERWHAEFDYLALARNQRSAVGHIGGIDFGQGHFTADVDAEMRTRSYRLAVGYAIVRDADKEFGLMAGAAVTDVAVRVLGAATVRGRPLVVVDESREETVPAPLIGVFASYRLGPHWALDGRANVARFTTHRYEGRMSSMHANLLYHVSPQIHVGLGWRRDDLRIDGEGKRWSGDLHARFNGPQVFVQAGF